MKFKMSARVKLNDRQVRQLVGKAAQAALIKSGANVRERAQDSMSNRTPLKTPKQWRVGTKDGTPLVALVTQIPKEDKVTSWKQGRHPGGLLKQDIRYEFDKGSKSVVVGPSALPRINRIHEFGGSVSTYWVPVSNGPKRSRKFKGARFGVMQNKATPGAVSLGIKRVKARPFMSKGLAKSMRSIPKQFRDTLHQAGRPVK